MKDAGQVLFGDARTLVEQSGIPVETVLLDSPQGPAQRPRCNAGRGLGGGPHRAVESRARRRPAPCPRQRRREDRTQRDPRRCSRDAALRGSRCNGRHRDDSKQFAPSRQPLLDSPLPSRGALSGSDREHSFRTGCVSQLASALRRWVLALCQSPVIQAIDPPRSNR
jgi:hypothetical protein